MLLCKKTGDNYFREEVAFKSLNDLEYALNQVSNFLARAAEWQKIAVDKDIANMTKDDDKTRVALDKERRRIENFTFKTSRTDSGKLECRIFVRFEKSVPNLGYFRSFESDATVDDYIKHIEKAYAAVGAFKADVRRREAEAKKRTETADVFN